MVEVARVEMSSGEAPNGTAAQERPAPRQDNEGPAASSYQSLVTRNRELQAELAEGKALADQLREALTAARAEAEAANRARSEFLSIMSHELRTPLNAIAGHVQLIDLELHGPVTDAQREALARIARSQQQLLVLVNDVLNLSRIESGDMKYAADEVEVEPIAREVVEALEPLFRRTNLACEVIAPPADSSPLVAVADGDKLRQVLYNLLTNALKFTRSGGRVTLSIAESRDRPDTISVVVRDTGLGIAAVRLRRVFEPFGSEPPSTTRQLDGTGLSLAISRDLARGMGGDLRAESVPGEGSTFTLDLPRAGKTPPATRPGADARESETRIRP